MTGTFTPLRVDPEPSAEPPCDVHSEQALLGALLIANGAYRKVAQVGLRPTHFWTAVHGRICEAIGTLIGRGGRYLQMLADSAVTVSNAEGYARAIVDSALRREIMAAAQETITASAHPTAKTSAADNIVWLRDRLDEIAKDAPARHTREDILARVSLTSWLDRDIPPLDRLLGDMLTTTTRMMLVAPTGLGKTNIALAMAVAVALGRDFLHWRGAGRPRRVLYLDGEMSQRLMKQRIIAAARRAGMGEDLSAEDLATLQANLFVLNYADFPDLAPLNTAAGQQFIDETIEQLGGVDLAVFDNIQALTGGDQLDPVEWQPVLSWAKQLTNRQIGQLWIHHTGHDETHAYGPKMREWQLDTVALLERVERPTADIAFKIRFTKARERTPDNRADFDEAIVTLADDTWSSERGGQSPGKRAAPDRVFELLQDAIAANGVIPPEAGAGHVPRDMPCVPLGLWRRCCEMGCISDGDPDPVKKAAADRKAFWRASNRLLDAGRVGKWNDLVWVVR